jgi:multidrug resistance efflux pump
VAAHRDRLYVDGPTPRRPLRRSTPFRPADGTVHEAKARAGQQVRAGTVLAVIAAETEEQA